MVQSSRLNNNLHPLLPIVAFITMVIIISILFVPRILSGIIKPFDQYERARAKLLSEYYQENVKLTTLLSTKTSSISQYEKLLIEANDILSKQQVAMSKIVSINIEELKTENNSKNRETINNNIATDSENFEFTNRIYNIVTTKLDSINTYNNILKYDSCIKKIRDKYNLDTCRNIYKEIEQYGFTNITFGKLNTEFLYNYNELSKSQRISYINRIVKISNGLISELEDTINKPIPLK